MIAGKEYNIDAFEISRLLDKSAINDILVLDEAGSTNTVSIDKLKSGELSPPFALIAKKQSAGHGRLGRRWFSAEGATLCVSVAVPVDPSAKSIESFTVRAGVSICEKLSNDFSADIFLKWPNDIYSSEGKKIAGMLAELILGGNGSPHIIVFGVGINYDLSILEAKDIPEDIIGTVADIKSVSRADFTINELAAAVIGSVLRASRTLEEPDLIRNFGRFDWLKGKEVSFSVSGMSENGVARGVDESGRLLLELPDGSTRILNSGEATTHKNNI